MRLANAGTLRLVGDQCASRSLTASDKTETSQVLSAPRPPVTLELAAFRVKNKMKSNKNMS